jgi:hypothetical protein
MAESKDRYPAGTVQMSKADVRTGRILEKGPVRPLYAHKISRQKWESSDEGPRKKRVSSTRNGGR